MPNAPLEILLDALLSRPDKKIRQAYVSRDCASRLKIVYTRLKRTLSEVGWRLAQVISAQPSLLTLSQLEA